MKIDMEFKGLEELVKAFESAASDEDIAQGDGGDVRRGIDTVGIRNIHTIVRTDSDSPVQRKRQRRGSKTCQ